jgi:hypothetical protein
MDEAPEAQRLSDLLDQYAAILKAKGDSPCYVKQARARIRALIARCKRPGDIDANKWRGTAAEMLQVDLEAAKIDYDTTDGRADFHALRRTYITSQARLGMHPKHLQLSASPPFSSPEPTRLLFGQREFFLLCRRTAPLGARLRREDLERFGRNGVSQGDKATANLAHSACVPRTPAMELPQADQWLGRRDGRPAS